MWARFAWLLLAGTQPYDAEVLKVLTAAQALRYLHLFEENEVAARDLPLLTRKHLVDLGVDAIGPRNRLLAAISVGTVASSASSPSTYEIDDPNAGGVRLPAFI